MLVKKIHISTLSFIFFFSLLSSILSCGKEQRPGSKTNTPPAITSVTISPNNPNKESELNLFIQSHDPDGDAVTYYYQWIKNNEEVPEGNASNLKSENLKKGDIICVRVTPSDGKEDGKPFLSEPVKILNSPPIIQEVRIEPKTASARDDLKNYVKGFDADGDFIYYTYQWEKNGVVLSEETKEILEKGRFKKGDSISVTVTPDDREFVGKPMKSEPINIANSPPIIISSPPSNISGNIYTYQVAVNDPDNDPVVFNLKTAPKRMEINKETGLIRWEIQKGDQGTHSIEIEACDSEGAKSSQKYTLSLKLRGY